MDPGSKHSTNWCVTKYMLDRFMLHVCLMSHSYTFTLFQNDMLEQAFLSLFASIVFGLFKERSTEKRR